MTQRQSNTIRLLVLIRLYFHSLSSLHSPKKHSKRPAFQRQSLALYSFPRHWRTLIKRSQTSPTSESQCPGANSKLSARPIALLSLPDSFSGSAVMPTMYLLMRLYFLPYSSLLVPPQRPEVTSWVSLQSNTAPCPSFPSLFLLSSTSHFAIVQLTLFNRVADHSIPVLHLQCVFLFKTGLM